MGYRIEYLGHGKVKVRKGTRMPIPRWYIVMVCVSFAFVALAIGLHNNQVRNFFLPGDPTVTANALQDLVNDLRGGESVEDALTAFCIEVIENAQVLR